MESPQVGSDRDKSKSKSKSSSPISVISSFWKGIIPILLFYLIINNISSPLALIFVHLYYLIIIIGSFHVVDITSVIILKAMVNLFTFLFDIALFFSYYLLSSFIDSFIDLFIHSLFIHAVSIIECNR